MERYFNSLLLHLFHSNLGKIFSFSFDLPINHHAQTSRIIQKLHFLRLTPRSIQAHALSSGYVYPPPSNVSPSHVQEPTVSIPTNLIWPVCWGVDTSALSSFISLRDGYPRVIAGTRATTDLIAI